MLVIRNTSKKGNVMTPMTLDCNVHVRHPFLGAAISKTTKLSRQGSKENPWSNLTRSCSMRRFKVSLAAKITSCAHATQNRLLKSCSCRINLESGHRFQMILKIPSDQNPLKSDEQRPKFSIIFSMLGLWRFTSWIVIPIKANNASTQATHNIGFVFY